MERRTRVAMLIGMLSGVVAAPGGAQTSVPDSLPAGVTIDMIAQGKQVYGGAGVCFACHGMDGLGGTGPSLADSVWIHSRGEYDQLVALIQAGVPAKDSKSGVVMPPRGGSAIGDADLRAVAAYVWSLSRRRSR